MEYLADQWYGGSVFCTHSEAPGEVDMTVDVTTICSRRKHLLCCRCGARQVGVCTLQGVEQPLDYAETEWVKAGGAYRTIPRIEGEVVRR